MDRIQLREVVQVAGFEESLGGCDVDGSPVGLVDDNGGVSPEHIHHLNHTHR